MSRANALHVTSLALTKTADGLMNLQANMANLIPAIIFAAHIAYQGARADRKTHLTDMDADGRTSVYCALSNSGIGVMLLFGSLLGVLADAFGPSLVLALLGVHSGSAILTEWRLSEVQAD